MILINFRENDYLLTTAFSFSSPRGITDFISC